VWGGGLKNSYYDRVVPSFNFSRSIAELPIITLLASYFEVTFLVAVLFYFPFPPSSTGWGQSRGVSEGVASELFEFPLYPDTSPCRKVIIIPPRPPASQGVTGRSVKPTA